MVNEDNSNEQIEDTEITKSDEGIQRVETEKSFQETVKSGFDTLTDVVQSIAESQKTTQEVLGGLDNRLKALETPSDLPLTPKGTAAGDDVGAKVTVPRDPYPQGTQAGLDDDRSGGDKPVSDKGGLKMQKKSDDTEIVEKSEHNFTTETPRPNASPETVEKSYQTDFSPILKDAREVGHEGLSKVAQNILSGKYYKPSDDEVRGF